MKSPSQSITKMNGSHTRAQLCCCTKSVGIINTALAGNVPDGMSKKSLQFQKDVMCNASSGIQVLVPA